jgi:hypothetical protein
VQKNHHVCKNRTLGSVTLALPFSGVAADEKNVDRAVQVFGGNRLSVWQLEAASLESVAQLEHSHTGER